MVEQSSIHAGSGVFCAMRSGEKSVSLRYQNNGPAGCIQHLTSPNHEPVNEVNMTEMQATTIALIPIWGRRKKIIGWAMVDGEDYDLVAQYRWRMSGGRRYAVAKGKPILLMHRLIANTPDGMVTDHINGNRLDNRRCNLRVCTHSENIRNQSGHRNSTSRFCGVGYIKRGGVFDARICVDRKQIYLGRFRDEEEAARAYDRAALKYHGEFARLNYPS